MDRIKRYPIDECFIPELKNKFVELLTDEFFFYKEVPTLDESTKKILSIVFDWVIGRYEPERGFLLHGSYGNGKSSIMKAALKLVFHIFGKSEIQPNGIERPKYITAKSMARVFKDGEKFKINELIFSGILGVDDIGYESTEVISFGTRVYPFEEILMERYDRKKIILLTTNKSPEQIESIYGGHVLDRLNQMCFWIEINTPSKRI